MFEVTNNDRASWANTALSAFAVECYAPGAEEDETIMRDLLTDFRHLADAQGWDIESMWAGSRLTYIEEVAEDGGPATDAFGAAQDIAKAECESSFPSADDFAVVAVFAGHLQDLHLP